MTNERQARLIAALRKARQLPGWSVYVVQDTLSYSGPGTFAQSPTGARYSRFHDGEIVRFITDVESAQLNS